MELPKLKREDTSVVYITKVPVILKADFKSCCAKKQTTMRKAILNFMKREVDKMRQQNDDC